MGHRTHQGQTVRDASGLPVLIGDPLLAEDEFQALQGALLARSNGTRRTRRRTTALLTGVAYCSGCDGRMYFAARKGYPYGDYGCRATARGEVGPAPAAVRTDWLEEYTLSRYQQTRGANTAVSREQLLRDGVRVTVSKGRSGGVPQVGPDTSRLRFTLVAQAAVRQND
ncbi:zinc ribbon domain-containing protein [Streptomyces sp. NPDC057740]|uniref:zinc ribbon domain-containing protein n=1 Tax=Streptomyces sp. NPDC057740 TaxID=3346234 RepID=UPI0036851A47